MSDYIIYRQKQWEKKWQREADLEAEREAEREAELAAEELKRKEAAERKKLLREQQEAERLRQQRLQEKEKLDGERLDKQVDTLLIQLEDLQRQREDDERQEIRFIIQYREPSLGVLDWPSWLSDPLNRRLAELDFEYAVEIFKRDNLMARRRTGGRNKRPAVNYFLSFTGDTNSQTRKGDLVATDFNPDDFDLNLGFTISYWVRPDELGSDMFAIGRKAHNHERFTFGIARAHKGYFGVGANTSERRWETMLDAAGMDKATNLTLNESDEWELTEGRWYHFAVTYANRVNDDSGTLRKIYMNGQQIWGTGVSDGPPNNAAGNINWSSTGREMSKGMSFGMRAVRGSGTSTSYNNGWACGLDEVAIYDEEKDASWVLSVYNGGTKYDHSDATKSDNDSTAKAAGTSQRGLVAYWKFNEGSGTTVKDLSGFGNHGLLTNDSYGDDGGAGWVDPTSTPTWETRK